MGALLIGDDFEHAPQWLGSAPKQLIADGERADELRAESELM
jgi:hypothetical protein